LRVLKGFGVRSKIRPLFIMIWGKNGERHSSEGSTVWRRDKWLREDYVVEDIMAQGCVVEGYIVGFTHILSRAI
jgi:hypothetical protein